MQKLTLPGGGAASSPGRVAPFIMLSENFHASSHSALELVRLKNTNVMLEWVVSQERDARVRAEPFEPDGKHAQDEADIVRWFELADTDST